MIGVVKVLKKNEEIKLDSSNYVVGKKLNRLMIGFKRPNMVQLAKIKYEFRALLYLF